jgi:hypothetical protein
MVQRSTAFDEPEDSDDDLYVFSGSDLLMAHYDFVDLDWREVAERSAIDERRGLVITQVAVLEDLIDEFIIYLEDPLDTESMWNELGRSTIGPRLDRLEAKLSRLSLLDAMAHACLRDVRAVVNRRNQLAHGTIHCEATSVIAIKDLAHQELAVHWVLVDRRTRAVEGITMSGLRQDLHDAIRAFTTVLSYAEYLVERAPGPVHFPGGAYLAAPTD